MSDRDGNSLGWFLAGLGLGAVVGLLYAPRSGSETADRGRDVVSQQKEQFRAAYEAGRQAYHETTSEAGAPKNV